MKRPIKIYNSKKINVEVNCYSVSIDQVIYIHSFRKQGERNKAGKTNLTKPDSVKYVSFPSLIHGQVKKQAALLQTWELN